MTFWGIDAEDVPLADMHMPPLFTQRCFYPLSQDIHICLYLSLEKGHLFGYHEGIQEPEGSILCLANRAGQIAFFNS